MDAVTHVQGQQRTMLTGDGDTRLVREVRCVSEAITRMASAITCTMFLVRRHGVGCPLLGGRWTIAWRQSAEACTRQAGRRAF